MLNRGGARQPVTKDSAWRDLLILARAIVLLVLAVGVALFVVSGVIGLLVIGIRAL